MAIVEVGCPGLPFQCRWCGNRHPTGNNATGSVFCRHTGTVHEFRFRPVDIAVNGLGDYATSRFNQAMARRQEIMGDYRGYVR